MKYEQCLECMYCCKCCSSYVTGIRCSGCEHHDEFKPIEWFTSCPLDSHSLKEDIFDECTKSIMNDHSLSLKTVLSNRALTYNDIILPRSVNKSDIFLKGYIHGFACHRNMTLPMPTLDPIREEDDESSEGENNES